MENILDKLNSEALNHSERYEVATIFMKIEDLFSKRKMRKKATPLLDENLSTNNDSEVNVLYERVCAAYKSKSKNNEALTVCLYHSWVVWIENDN